MLTITTLSGWKPLDIISKPEFDEGDPYRFKRRLPKEPEPPPPRRKTPDVPSWRGHGGRAATYSSVEFDRQLDKISMWIEKWNHIQRCQLIEWILRKSNHNQFQFLYTAMQPHLHRDLMYTAQSRYPSMEFKPFSTHSSREVQRKLILHRQDDFYRVKSGYFRLDDDVKNQAREKQSVKFPNIPIEKPTPDPRLQRVTTDFSSLSNPPVSRGSSNPPPSRASTGMLPFLTLPRKQKHSNLKTKKRLNEPLMANDPELLYKSDPTLRFVDMPMRRHIQDESNPKSLLGSVTNLDDFKQQTQKIPNKVVKSSSDFSLDIKIFIPLFNYLLSDVKRNEFLHKFILKLDPRQHYFISSFLSVRQHRDFLALLPENVALKILGYLTPKEILTCSRVSKTWFKLANNNDVWMNECKEIDIKVPIPSNPNWKHVYRDNLYLKINWENGDCRMLDLRGHTDQVEEIIFNNKYLASGSQDKTIKIWDLRNGKLLQTLVGHKKGVWCLNFYTKSLIVSGSHDGTIKVWNMKMGLCLRTIIGHDGPVWAMVRHENTLVSTSQDKMAKIWDISRCIHLHTLAGHGAAVFAVDMSENGSLVITGSADKTVRIWSTETGKQLQRIWASQTTSIMAVSYSQGYIAYSYGETICLYNTNPKAKKRLVRSYEEHSKRIETVRLKITDKENLEGSIISAGKDAMVKYWDVKKKTSVHTKNLKGSVKAIFFDDLRIASGNGNHIRIFDFNFYDHSLVKKKPPQDTENLHMVTVNPSHMEEISEMEKLLLDPEDVEKLQRKPDRGFEDDGKEDEKFSPVGYEEMKDDYGGSGELKSEIPEYVNSYIS
ncbi:hypothetical protein FSP39_021090 [Pinctada imbricata]|uniref:F-box domain-containing protein n=1 Tax=Pinctada imbricata TaxID=66713 RepID=A0AA89C466_PINIB|nr:hypothetical protein FSP39_021090 [Pinctada imbricata]